MTSCSSLSFKEELRKLPQKNQSIEAEEVSNLK